MIRTHRPIRSYHRVDRLRCRGGIDQSWNYQLHCESIIILHSINHQIYN